MKESDVTFCVCHLEDAMTIDPERKVSDDVTFHGRCVLSLCVPTLARMKSVWLPVEKSQPPGFDHSIHRHSGIWGAADEAMLNKGLKNQNKKDPPEKVYISMSNLWPLLSRPNLSNRKVSHTYRPLPHPNWTKVFETRLIRKYCKFLPSPERVVRGRIGQGHPRLFVRGHIDRGRNDIVPFGIPTVPWNGKDNRCPIFPSLPFPLAPRPASF
jgi:hypothetical protein